MKQVNFIYGRNGSGKSTLTRLIKEQCDKYDVHIFNGFEQLLDENERLNAIALGSENSNTLQQVNELEKKIEDLASKVEDGSELKLEHEKRCGQWQKADEMYKDALTKAAREIKNKDNPRITTTGYNRNYFEQDISKAQIIPDGELPDVKQAALGVILPKAAIIKLPEIDLPQRTNEVKQLAGRSLTKQVMLPEIGENSDKEHFAREGMRIHQQGIDTVCAFCGGEITEQRWQRLDSYFDDAAKRLEEEIDRVLDELHDELKKISDVSALQTSRYYDQLEHEAKTLNDRISKMKSETMEHIRVLIDTLNKRKRSLFTTVPLADAEIPAGFSLLQQEVDKLNQQNDILTQSVDKRKEEAKERLKFHYVQEALDRHNILDLKKELDQYKESKSETNKQIEDIEGEIEDKKEERKEKIRKMRREEELAKEVNDRLSAYGADFELDHYEDPEEGEGFYRIRDTETQSVRPITQLSMGEKNIIAFLYFMGSLRAPRDSKLPVMAVFDDPMSSNDDTFQYLIISALERYYADALKSKKNGANKERIGSDDCAVVILTHNIHFYLNVQPYGNREESKIGAFHLIKHAGSSSIHEIPKSKEFMTAYDALWDDMVFAYRAQRPNCMWNLARRIIETFCKFNKKQMHEVLLKTTEIDGVLGGALKKNLDANSHNLLDFEAETNGCDCEQIRDFVRQFFSWDGHEDHFNRCWNSIQNYSDNIQRSE